MQLLLQILGQVSPIVADLFIGGVKVATGTVAPGTTETLSHSIWVFIIEQSSFDHGCFIWNSRGSNNFMRFNLGRSMRDIECQDAHQMVKELPNTE
jgi:hypothetical protein